MAFFTDTRSDATTLDVFRSIPHRMRRSMERRRRIGEVRRELAILSDRDLNDIGLSRHDIDHVAREAADKA